MNSFFRKKIIPAHTKLLARGATLVEVLVYVVIITLLISIIVYVLIDVSHLERHVTTLRQIETSAISSLERISREVRGATSVDVAQSVFGTDLGVLVLQVPVSPGVSKNVEFNVVDGVVYMEEDGVSQGPITSPQITVTRLAFSLISHGLIQGVKIEATFLAGQDEYQKTKNFYSTVIVRNTY